MEKQKLQTLRIDVEKGIYELNGESIGESTSEVQLEFKDGIWTLMVSRDSIYTTSVKGD